MAGTIATPEPSTGADPVRAAVAGLVDRGYARARALALTGAAASLRDALRAGGLVVHYQPVVSLPDRRVLGFEALARVRMTAGSVLQPARFIDVAEASGLIVPLGLEVLVAAASALSGWRRSPTLADAYVSVNVSSAQLADETFAASVKEILRTHGLPAAAMVLEVTESRVAGPDAERTMAVVEETGVRLALDDFGTGSATLDSLRRLPVHMLKLDRTFVRGVGHGGQDMVIVRNVLELAYELDLLVVAKGVETQEQAISLATWGCAAAQGFLFGQPAPAELVRVATSDAAARAVDADAAADPAERTTAAAIARILALTDADGDEERALIHAVATGLGKAMRLPASTVRDIGLAALCHDVARLRPLLRDHDSERFLPAVLAALLERRITVPGDEGLVGQLVEIAVDIVASARVDGAEPLPHRLTGALLSGAEGRPNRIAHAMRRFAEHVPPMPTSTDHLLRTHTDTSADARPTADRLRALRLLSQAVDPTADSRNLVGLLAEEALDIIGAASLSLSRWERDEGVLRVLVNVGQLTDGEERYPEDETYPMSDRGAGSRLLAAGVPFVESSADEHGEPRGRREPQHQRGKGSSAAVPVYANDRLWGELYVTTADDKPPFVARDLEHITAIADILGGALAYGEQLERMARLAFEDPLTGLANRRAIDDRLEDALHETTEPVTVVMIDVNGLKQVNDEYGHATGDKALRSVADALSGATLDLPDATSARLGGDEFCVVVVGDDGGAAATVVDRAAALLRSAPAPQVTISAGAATSTRAGRTVRQLFAAADQAQYQAKRTGRALLLVGGVDDDATPSVDIDRPGRLRAHDVRPVTTAGTAFEATCGRVVETLGAMVHAPVRAVLEAVGGVMSDACDLSRWLLSDVGADGVIRIQHLHLRRTRPITHQDRVVPPEDEIYHLDDYPLTRAAIERPEPYWIHVNEPTHDAAERAVLQDLGMTAVLGIGAPNDEGGWLLELYADEHTDDLEPFVPLGRLVALAVRT